MAQKYLMAMDYMDFHTQTVLNKHAKKRPLGDIETKHRYTPTQPVLSCRTVDIDVSGTRTYRPKSSADIIQEQHALIHKIYSKSRNVTSAPQNRVKSPRNLPEDNFQQHQRINIEVHGRPLTSQSNVSGPSPRKTPAFSRRPKTTGGANTTSRSGGFLLVKADSDLSESRRSYRNLTNKIHEHWDPENHNLNTGVFVRGKQQIGRNTKQDAWLTFSGSQSEDAQGIIDAFAEKLLEEEEEDEEQDLHDIEKQNDYYNIEGGVGSRIAHQLQKGDKIRIGVNGEVHSQDLKVKKWGKEPKSSNSDEMDRVKSGSSSGKENISKSSSDKVIPLCWDDQLQEGGTKVIMSRGNPLERSTINLCETRPVIFNKLIMGDDTSSSRASNHSQQGFRVKQRQKNRPGIDGKEQKNKVTVVTIDARSEEEEEKLNGMTVDDVIKKNCDGKTTVKSSQAKHNGEPTEKHVTLNLNIEEHGASEDNVMTASRGSLADSLSSGSMEYKYPKVRPTPPTYSTKAHQVELGIIGSLPIPPNSRPMSNEYDPRSAVPGLRSMVPPKSPQNRVGSARSSTRGGNKPNSAKSISKSIISNSSNNLLSQSMRNVEAEFIQISHPVKNPNPTLHKKTKDFPPQGMSNDMIRGPRSHSGVREPMPSPELGVYEDNDDIDSPPMSPGPPSSPVKAASATLAISIPTAEFDSILDSPSHRNGLDSENNSKRANDMRDEQIDQITDMLVDAIIQPKEGEETNTDISS